MGDRERVRERKMEGQEIQSDDVCSRPNQKTT